MTDVFTSPNDYMNLGEAKVWLGERLVEGAKCPCCNQFAKIYTRKLNAGMARSLLQMFLAGGIDNYVDVTVTGLGGSREEGKLRHWRLIEEATEPRDDGGRAGWWRVTRRGGEFILGRIEVQSHVQLFNNEFLGYEGSLVTFDQCLGNQFDLAELKAARAGML